MSELLKIFKFISMKTTIAAILLCASFPVNAYDNYGFHNNHESYKSQRGYAYENKCFRYEYREYYVPGTLMSPGYVKTYNEKVSVPCNTNNRALNHYYYKTKKPTTSYVNHKYEKKCTGSTTLGGLIGGGIAASLSKRDAYAWTIPLGAVLGAGIGNAECM